MAQLAVVGSLNMDMVNQVDEHPRPGETVRGWGTAYYPGGKGANQAVAAAMAGAQVRMLGAVGDDGFGSSLLEELTRRQVSTEHLLRKPVTSGMAFITVSRSGENSIILSEGANGLLTDQDAEQAVARGLLQGVSAVLLQNEIPWAVNVRILELAAESGVPVYLNPAPATDVPEEQLRLVHTLVVNETEAAVISGAEARTPEEALLVAERLRVRGVRNVIVTLGEQGAVYAGEEGTLVQSAYKVEPVDTTAAGDTFIGVYAAARARGESARSALDAASAAAALAVTRRGAQESIPMWHEIAAFRQGT
ncbi:ribokinase [Paenibacillus sp. YYML68]|uniref:ribokinase n=1 Tax=Paenibacillus sp. YYML68 TaxID=2909250 RepID=UPI002491EEA7|nr:ribokinase [Paenibacillus sp. YYML68]